MCDVASHLLASLREQCSPHSDERRHDRFEVIAREQIDAMIAARRAMTAGQRQVFAGMLNDKSQRQLAAELGWPRKTVMLAQRSAREKLAAHQALAA